MPRDIAENKDKRTGNLLSYQTLVIAAIPLIGYAMAYVYEWGYCSKFGIPPELISVDLTNVFITIGKIIGILAFWTLGALIIIGIKPKNPTLRLTLAPLFWPTLILLFLIIIFWGGWLLMAVFGSIYIIAILILFLRAIFTRKDKGKSKVEPTQKSDTQDDPYNKLVASLESFFSNIGKRNDLVIYLAISFSILLIAFSFLVSVADSTKQADFLILSTNNNSVVLRIYDDNLICAPFDRTTKIVQREFFIIKMGDPSTPRLTTENVGPLH
jgi:hypothetical protein